MSADTHSRRSLSIVWPSRDRCERHEGQRVRSCEGAGARRGGQPEVNPVISITSGYPFEGMLIYVHVYLDLIFGAAARHSNS